MAVEEYDRGFLLSEVPLGEGFLDLAKMIETLRRHQAGLRGSGVQTYREILTAAARRGAVRLGWNPSPARAVFLPERVRQSILSDPRVVAIQVEPKSLAVGAVTSDNPSELAEIRGGSNL